MSRKDRLETEKSGLSQNAPESQGRTRGADYIWANLIFFVFLGVLLFVAHESCIAPGDAQMPAIPYVLDGTFVFLFALLGGTFVVVTLFDAAYEFFAVTAEKPLPPEEAPRT